jgi:hypothetical protein
MRIGDIARLVRSKNAGPFMLTIDVLFADRETFDRINATGALSVERVAKLYSVDPDRILAFVLPDALTVKLSFPRDVPSGSLGDSDVYGCQYMARLAGAEIAETS